MRPLTPSNGALPLVVFKLGGRIDCCVCPSFPSSTASTSTSTSSPPSTSASRARPSTRRNPRFLLMLLILIQIVRVDFFVRSLFLPLRILVDRGRKERGYI